VKNTSRAAPNCETGVHNTPGDNRAHRHISTQSNSNPIHKTPVNSDAHLEIVVLLFQAITQNLTDFHL
jgi:hypothetical protein